MNNKFIINTCIDFVQMLYEWQINSRDKLPLAVRVLNVKPDDINGYIVLIKTTTHPVQENKAIHAPLCIIIIQ